MTTFVKQMLKIRPSGEFAAHYFHRCGVDDGKPEPSHVHIGMSESLFIFNYFPSEKMAMNWIMTEMYNSHLTPSEVLDAARARRQLSPVSDIYLHRGSDGRLYWCDQYDVSEQTYNLVFPNTPNKGVEELREAIRSGNVFDPCSHTRSPLPQILLPVETALTGLQTFSQQEDKIEELGEFDWSFTEEWWKSVPTTA